jgi:hypothetical protein
MHKLFVVSILVFFTTCKDIKAVKEYNSKNVISNAEKVYFNNPVLEIDIKSNLEYLASDELEGRNTGTVGIEKAAIFIEDFFKKNKVQPYFKTYRDSFNLKDIVGYNIVGYIEGNDKELKDEFVILGAHYDHIGTAKEVNGDTIANGANDDASGTVADMEWAKYFSKSKTNKHIM